LDKALMLRTGQATERSEATVSKGPDVILSDGQWTVLEDALREDPLWHPISSIQVRPMINRGALVPMLSPLGAMNECHRLTPDDPRSP
jgi:hypothetical protein